LIGLSQTQRINGGLNDFPGSKTTRD